MEGHSTRVPKLAEETSIEVQKKAAKLKTQYRAWSQRGHDERGAGCGDLLAVSSSCHSFTHSHVPRQHGAGVGVMSTATRGMLNRLAYTSREALCGEKQS